MAGSTWEFSRLKLSPGPYRAQQAFAIPIPDADNFNKLTTKLNTAPPGWISDNGTVDSIATGNPYGITCFNNSKGCVDLDGSTNHAGLFETAGKFHLVAGHTYELSAEVSGNQRGAGPDTLEFGFLKGTTTVLMQSTIVGIAANSAFTLYTLFFTPSTNVNARAFFYNVDGSDNQGPILDNVNIRAVPLPATAWLMLSGLAALGAVARRRITGATA
jgi:hypothetical protein